MKNKERLDLVLVKRGYFESRQRAKSEIMAGNIYVNNKMIDKPGTQVDFNCSVEIRKKVLPYVSRGGLKLEKAVRLFDIEFKNKVAIDAGASTGGFTDCLLKNGVKKVYAVDVGYGQLDYKLRKDKRVVVMERTNARYLKKEDIGESVDIITADLAFISLDKVFMPFYTLLEDDGDLIALIKPQFEVGRNEVGKKGVVRDWKLHVKAVTDVFKSANNHGLFEWGLEYSPITGPKGNIEFLAWFKKHKKSDNYIDIKEVVERAHSELNNS